MKRLIREITKTLVFLIFEIFFDRVETKDRTVIGKPLYKYHKMAGKFYIGENQIRYGLAILVALFYSAIFSMSYFHEGTSIGKYQSRQVELDRVNEEEALAYTDMMLFGDERLVVQETTNVNDSESTEAGFSKTQRIEWLDKMVTLGCMIAAWVMVLPALQKLRWLSLIYVLMGIHLIAMAFFKGVNGGAMFSELAIPAQATRWLACIALAAWLFIRPKSETNRLPIVTWILIFAASLTFATHGFEAFMLHPKFRDLLFGAFQWISIPISEPTVFVLLKLIGIMDICLAISILFVRHKAIFLWMAIWGGLAALARPIAFGEAGLEDALLRIANFGVPMALYFLTSIHKTQQSKTDITYNETSKTI